MLNVAPLIARRRRALASGDAAGVGPSSIIGATYYLSEFRPEEIPSAFSGGEIWWDKDSVYGINAINTAAAPTASEGVHVDLTSSSHQGMGFDTDFIPIDEFTIWYVIDPSSTDRGFLLGNQAQDQWVASAYNASSGPGFRSNGAVWLPTTSHVGTSKLLIRFGAKASTNEKVFAVGDSAENYEATTTWHANGVLADELCRKDAGLIYKGLLHRVIVASKMYRDTDSVVSDILDYCNTADELGL